MDVEAYDDFDDDEEEVEGDADNKGAVDLFEVDGMVMVAGAVGVVVGVMVGWLAVVGFVGMVPGVGGRHKDNVLSVVFSNGGENVDDLTVCSGIGGMGDIGRDGVGGAGGEEVLLAADDHFQLPVQDVGNLFVRVAVFGQAAAFPDLPDGEGAFVAVHHFSKKARTDLFGWDVGEIFHERFWGESTKKWGVSEGFAPGKRNEVTRDAWSGS